MVAEVEGLTRGEVAKILKRSLSTLDKMVMRGAIPPPVRLPGGQGLRWHAGVIKDWYDDYLRRGHEAAARARKTEAEESEPTPESKVEKILTTPVAAPAPRQRSGRGVKLSAKERHELRIKKMNAL